MADQQTGDIHMFSRVKFWHVHRYGGEEAWLSVSLPASNRDIELSFGYDNKTQPGSVEGITDFNLAGAGALKVKVQDWYWDGRMTDASWTSYTTYSIHVVLLLIDKEFTFNEFNNIFNYIDLHVDSDMLH